MEEIKTLGDRMDTTEENVDALQEGMMRVEEHAEIQQRELQQLQQRVVVLEDQMKVGFLMGPKGLWCALTSVYLRYPSLTGSL